MKIKNKIVAIINLLTGIMFMLYIDIVDIHLIIPSMEDMLLLDNTEMIFGAIVFIIVLITVIINIVMSVKNIKGKKKAIGVCNIFSIIALILIFCLMIINSQIPITSVFEEIMIGLIPMLILVLLIYVFNRKAEEPQKIKIITLTLYIIYSIIILFTILFPISKYNICLNSINEKLSNANDVKLSNCIGVKLGNKYQYINEKGKVEFEIECDRATNFKKISKENNKDVEIGMIARNNNIIFIDNKGEELYKVNDNSMNGFSILLTNFQKAFLKPYKKSEDYVTQNEYMTTSGIEVQNGEYIWNGYTIEESNNLTKLKKYVKESTENEKFIYYEITDDKYVEEIIYLNEINDVSQQNNNSIDINYAGNKTEANIIDIENDKKEKINCDNLVHYDETSIYIFKNGNIPFELKTQNKKGFVDINTLASTTIPYDYSIVDFIGEYILISYAKEDNNGFKDYSYFCVDKNGKTVTTLFTNVYCCDNNNKIDYDLQILTGEASANQDEIIKNSKEDKRYIVSTETSVYIINSKLEKLSDSYDGIFLSENEKFLLAYNADEKKTAGYRDVDIGYDGGTYKIISIDGGNSITKETYRLPSIGVTGVSNFYLEQPINNFLYKEE